MDSDHPSSKYSVTPIVWTVITLLLQCDSHSVDGDHPSSKYSVTPIVWTGITLLLNTV